MSINPKIKDLYTFSYTGLFCFDISGDFVLSLLANLLIHKFRNL